MFEPLPVMKSRNRANAEMMPPKHYVSFIVAQLNHLFGLLSARQLCWGGALN